MHLTSLNVWMFESLNVKDIISSNLMMPWLFLDCRQITFVTLNGFYPLSKTSPTRMSLTDNIKMKRIPNKIKWKMNSVLTLDFKFWSYFLQPSDLFYFLLFLSTSADITFHKFSELHSTLTGKKIFLKNFPFLTDSLNPPTP